MSKIMKISNFGSQGLNSDLPACELPVGFLTKGVNFRNISNAISPYGNYQTSSTLAHSAKFIYSVENKWIFFDATKAYEYDGITSLDITGPVITDDPFKWVGTALSQVLIFSSMNNFPVMQSARGADLIDLPYDVASSATWRSKNMRAKSIRSFGPFLIAMHIVENNVAYQDLVQWSHPADTGGVPDSWDYTRDDRLANRVNLGGNGGEIIDGAPLRDSFMIYRKNGITTFSATQDEFVFSIRNLSEIASAVNMRSIVEVKGSHFIMTYDDIIVNDGNSLNSILHNKVRRQFMQSFNQTKQQSAFAIKNELAKEIWFCISNNTDSCDVAFIYNWRDETWSIIDLPRLWHAGFGAIQTDSRTWNEWLSPTGGFVSWDTSTGVWDQDKLTPFDETIIGIQEGTNKLLNMHLIEPESPVVTVIERTNIPIEGHEVVTSIQRIYPHFEGIIGNESYVLISAGSHLHANSAVQWKPPVKFYPGIDRKVDIRTTGELHAFKIESQIKEQWRLSGLDIEYEVTGQR